MTPIPSPPAVRVFADSRPDARRRRRVAVLVIGGLLAVLPAAAADTALPDLGDAAGETLTRAEEERLGDAFLSARSANALDWSTTPRWSTTSTPWDSASRGRIRSGDTDFS